MRRKLLVVAMLLGLIMLVGGPAVAAQKSGCPAGSGWTKGSVTDTAAQIWPELLDQSPWPGGEAEFAATAIAGFDRNGDSDVCVKTMWTELNPNSNWYGVLMFLVRDNTANASG